MSAPSGPGYQPDNASAKIGAASLLGVLALAALGGAIAWALYIVFTGHAVRAPATSLERAPLATSGPKLETDPRKDRLALETAARARLQSYGWVDRQQGVAHIPIERAMALQAQRGWPDAETPP